MKFKRVKIVFLSLFLIFPLISYGQKYIALITGVSEGYHPLFDVFIDHTNIHLSSDFQIGVQLEFNKGCLGIAGNYQLYGNFTYFDGPNYKRVEHLIGLNTFYRFSKTKRFSPIIELSLLTEVGTNNKNNPPMGYERYYNSTPFVASLGLGYEFRIIESLNVRLMFENGIRMVQTKTLEWIGKEPEGKKLNNLLESRPIEIEYIDVMGLRLGVSYTFPFKKEKPLPQ